MPQRPLSKPVPRPFNPLSALNSRLFFFDSEGEFDKNHDHGIQVELFTMALRERKEQLRVIFNTSQAGIILVGSHGTILLANNRMAEMFGMSLSQLVGSSYTDHLHPAERALGDERMKQLIRSGGAL